MNAHFVLRGIGNAIHVGGRIYFEKKPLKPLTNLWRLLQTLEKTTKLNIHSNLQNPPTFPIKRNSIHWEVNQENLGESSVSNIDVTDYRRPYFCVIPLRQTRIPLLQSADKQKLTVERLSHRRQLIELSGKGRWSLFEGSSRGMQLSYTLDWRFVHFCLGWLSSFTKHAPSGRCTWSGEKVTPGLASQVSWINPGNHSGGEDWDQGGQNQFGKEVVAKRQKTKHQTPSQGSLREVSTLNRGK